MRFPENLRVIGSRSVYELFLPPAGGPFSCSEFIHVANPNGETIFGESVDDGYLTIIVNPDDFSSEELGSLPGPLWLWFLRRLSPPHESLRDSAPRLYAEALEIVMERRRTLSGTLLGKTDKIVVSDRDSQEYCLKQGWKVALSPPPVTDDIGVTGRWSDTAGLPIAQFSENLTNNKLLAGVASFPNWNLELREIARKADLLSLKHIVVTQESLFPSFPYGVAVGLLAGLSVIAEPLTPRWGLEPGIDFLEVSTPEELVRMVEHIRRYGNLTQLMARRGNLKSPIFKSTVVFGNLLAGHTH